MTAPMAGFGPMAWSPLSGAGGGGTPPVVNTTTTTFEGGPWTFTRDAGAAEDIITFSVADDAASYFRLRNATALATQFAPEIVSLSDNSLPGLSLSVQTNNDVGVQPAVLLTTYVSGTIRPLLQFYNSGGTPLVDVDGLGTWTFVKPAETGVAETITQWGVADSALRLVLKNLPTADTEFVPCFIWPNNGAGAPTFTTRSTGTRLVLRDTIDASTADFAVGYTTNQQWYSVGKATASYSHVFYAGTTPVLSLYGDGLTNILANQAGKTTLGNARVLELQNQSGSSNERVEIGMGYASGSTYYPVVIGHLATDVSGKTKGNVYIATRDVTTDTAPTERVVVTSDGLVDCAGTIRATGTTAPTGGVGAEVFYAGGTATFTGINRGAGTVTAVVLDGNSTYIRHNGAERITTDALGSALHAPLYLKSYTVATLPSAATATGLIYVSDESGGAVPAFSDGANWRRVTDRAVVS